VLDEPLVSDVGAKIAQTPKRAELLHARFDQRQLLREKL
jgi:hypothetical protein